MEMATGPSVIHKSQWLSWLYSKFNFESEIRFLIVFGIFICFIFVIKAFIGYGLRKYIIVFSSNMQVDLRSKLMKAYMGADYTFQLKTNTAHIIQNILSETRIFCQEFLLQLIRSTVNLSILTFLLAVLIATDWVATNIILTLLLLILVFLYQFKDKIKKWGEEISDTNRAMIRVINHGMYSFKETRVIGCESYFEEQLKQQAHKYKLALEKAQTFGLLPRHILETSLVIFLIGYTLVSVLTNRSPQDLTATLSVFGISAIRLLPAATGLAQNFTSIRKSSYAVDRLFFHFQECSGSESKDLEFCGSYGEISKFISSTTAESSSAILSFQDKISISQVTYKYPSTTKPALKQISLEIYHGQSIGIIGKSGAGKTTLVDVILGLLKIDSGSFEVDGVTVDPTSRAWQNLIGYIPQSIALIDDTFERNVAFGVPDSLIDQERLKKATESAQLSDLVDQMPKGIKTPIGERGVLLSGGQRQRIGIARALYHQRKILVLDEATSALDNETENLVTQAINRLSGEKTMIIIAHRLSTIENCNCIYLMDSGKIIKSGEYKEVVPAN